MTLTFISLIFIVSIATAYDRGGQKVNDGADIEATEGHKRFTVWVTHSEWEARNYWPEVRGKKSSDQVKTPQSEVCPK